MTARKTAAAADMKSVETVVAASKEQLETVAAASKETIETMVKVGVDATQKGLAQAIQSAQEQAEKTSTMFFKTYDEVTTFSKDNADAVAKSGAIFAKGVEDAGKAVMALTQSQVEAAVGAFKSSLSCTTLRDVIDLQAGYARSSMDKMVAETTKLGEMAMKVANEAFAPIQDRYKLAFEKIAKPAA